jgi:hypothetical protein
LSRVLACRWTDPLRTGSVFSMSAALPLLSQPGLDVRIDQERAKSLPLRLPSVDAALPDGGLPKGAVVELASWRGLDRATSFALSACVSAQASARLRSGDERTAGAWCAFIDPLRTLHAPGVIRAGVDLHRLLVLRPDPSSLARVAVRVAESRVFSVVVIDTVSPPGLVSSGRERLSLDRWATVVRRLSIAIERSDVTVLLLTDASLHRSVVLPTAMRLEFSRGANALGSSAADDVMIPGRELELPLMMRVAKDRRGRVTGPTSILFQKSAS